MNIHNVEIKGSKVSQMKDALWDVKWCTNSHSGILNLPHSWSTNSKICPPFGAARKRLLVTLNCIHTSDFSFGTTHQSWRTDQPPCKWLNFKKTDYQLPRVFNFLCSTYAANDWRRTHREAVKSIFIFTSSKPPCRRTYFVNEWMKMKEPMGG